MSADFRLVRPFRPASYMLLALVWPRTSEVSRSQRLRFGTPTSLNMQHLELPPPPPPPVEADPAMSFHASSTGPTTPSIGEGTLPSDAEAMKEVSVADLEGEVSSC